MVIDRSCWAAERHDSLYWLSCPCNSAQQLWSMQATGNRERLTLPKMRDTLS